MDCHVQKAAQEGSAAAYLETGIFSPWRYSILLISSVLIITWLNLSNDVYDFDTGADKNKVESVVNLVGSLAVESQPKQFLLHLLDWLGYSLKKGESSCQFLIICGGIWFVVFNRFDLQRELDSSVLFCWRRRKIWVVHIEGREV
ncbi:uncharacterized protein LOC112173725 [Rosa chinensis]|uniref:uncharacterized protein LOC112173725 n=1 Tax=Rosa chinensis TaxID=74649 RepID=UPI001AD8E605|nr:uncharacterized protein LOC112173725 [Rosa chinensis]